MFHEALYDLEFDSKKKIKLLEHFDTILGLNIKGMKEEKQVIPKEIKDLANEREKLRKAKMWEDADLFRQRIQEKGYKLTDTEEGTKLEKM